ncbi:MAG: calcium/sodium antiporter [Pseudomonadota bacterium]
MTLAILALLVGLVVLAWSADLFVTGSASLAHYWGMSPMLIGMLVVGFGTSSPELMVSALAAMQGNSGLALGNAYGSNIANLALVLGVTALIKPITVQSKVLRKELPVLAVITALAAWQVSDGAITRQDASVLLVTFFAFMIWSVIQGTRAKTDSLAKEFEQGLARRNLAVGPATVRLVIGLALLIGSSQLLIWGAVGIAKTFGVSDLVIGLTVVAIGTSLPELASTVVAARRGDHDIALGNVIGSNMFNTLAVVGIAGFISPMSVGPHVLTRDVVVMSALTLSIFILGVGRAGRPGRINRFEGAGLFACYLGYTAYLASTMFLN